MESYSSSSRKFDLMCVVCGMEFASHRAFFAHFRVHHSEWKIHHEDGAGELPLPVVAGDGGFSSMGAGVDHLMPRLASAGKRWVFNPRPIVQAAALWDNQPPPPPPNSPEQGSGMELAAIFATDGEADPPAEKEKEHVCNLCGRWFPGSKALGGHNAHHAMQERKRQAAMGEDGGRNYVTVAVAANEGQVVVYHPVPRPPPPPPPRGQRWEQVRIVGSRPCPTCGRIFSSGQAVGAHKRYCRRPPIPLEMEPIIVNNFDLNELPPEAAEMEEEVLFPPAP